MSRQSRPRVYVFGGGVAGMTAAHELVIRGFEVCLYEREQALGPRGLLEDLTLGGMARTQYFMISEKQPEQLYFQADPLPLRRGRLLRRGLQELARELSKGDMREPMRQLGERFAMETMQGTANLVDPLMGALTHALPDERMPDFLEAFRGALEGRQGLEGFVQRLSAPLIPLSAETLMTGLREFTKEAPADSGRARMEALSSAFASALLDTGEGEAATVLLKDLVKSTGQLPKALRLGLRAFLAPSPGQGLEASSYFPAVWLELDGKTNELTEDSKTALEAHVRCVRELVGRYQLQTGLDRACDIQLLVQEFADPDLSVPNVFTSRAGQQGTAVAAGHPGSRAARVMTLLKEKLTDDELGKALQGKVMPHPGVGGGPSRAYSSLGFPPVARNWVRVICYRPQLPGEHGYRFFPSYYRHVFDTMAHIPLYDASGQPSGGTVLDNLVPLPEIGISSTRAAPFLMSWNPLQLGDALSRSEYNRRKMAELGLHSQDLLQFSLRVLRYMTSCSQRRAAEMEDLSWWQYLEGWEPRTQTRLYEYSPSFKHLVQSSSRVLAALDGKHGDARTCGNTYVQLLTQALVPTTRNNCTLNGPTSEAWFFHWRKHLERLGVTFVPGELSRLEWEKERLVARVGPARREAELAAPGTPETTLGLDETVPVYFVVATDLVSAARVVETLKAGVPAHLPAYVHEVPVAQGSQTLEKREPETGGERKWWDRLQTLTGIQFFFEKPVSVVDGYLYCVDARWGLSAICSHNVWQDRPIGSLSGYQSILSVDIGDWNTPSDNPDLKGKTAGQCTPLELAQEVLRQLRVSLSARGKDQGSAGYVLPEPDWIHIDESLEYESFENEPELDAKQERKLRSNRTPYLVPIAGDWKNRPGPEPWDPSPEAPPPPAWPHSASVWQAPHGGYPVHHDRLVFAGTWLRTFTRMTTMESANESARHAVNAILDHYSVQLDPSFAAAGQVRPVHETEAGPSNPYDKGLFPTTPAGDYCRIWNPESHELPDLERLQKRDEENFRKGRPHPWDALGLELLPSLLTHVPGLGDSVEQLIQWVVHKGADMPQATHGLVAVLRHLRTVLEAARPPRGY